MKYDKLITEYTADAVAIKALDDQRQTAAAALNAYWERVSESNGDSWNADMEAALAETWQAADEQYNEALLSLRYNVECEYAAVPYTAPRRAGIERVMTGLGF
ncbi:MAG: hypothetical protein ABIH03_16065 [Pseudomonadota bacterium]